MVDTEHWLALMEMSVTNQNGIDSTPAGFLTTINESAVVELISQRELGKYFDGDVSSHIPIAQSKSSAKHTIDTTNRCHQNDQ